MDKANAVRIGSEFIVILELKESPLGEVVQYERT